MKLFNKIHLYFNFWIQTNGEWVEFGWNFSVYFLKYLTTYSNFPTKKNIQYKYILSNLNGSNDLRWLFVRLKFCQAGDYHANTFFRAFFNHALHFVLDIMRWCWAMNASIVYLYILNFIVCMRDHSQQCCAMCNAPPSIHLSLFLSPSRFISLSRFTPTICPVDSNFGFDSIVCLLACARVFYLFCCVNFSSTLFSAVTCRYYRAQSGKNNMYACSRNETNTNLLSQRRQNKQ